MANAKIVSEIIDIKMIFHDDDAKVLLRVVLVLLLLLRMLLYFTELYICHLTCDNKGLYMCNGCTEYVIVIICNYYTNLELPSYP